MKFVLAMLASFVILLSVTIIIAMAVVDVVIDFDNYEEDEIDEKF